MPKQLYFTELLAEKEYIKQVAQKLGFANVRVADYGNASNTGYFSLVVDQNPDVPASTIKLSIPASAAFKTWLTYKYESKFFILPTSMVNDSGLKDVVKSSVSIDSEEAIKHLFGDRLEQMTVLKDYVEDEGDLEFLIPKIREKLGPQLDFTRPEADEAKEQEEQQSKEDKTVSSSLDTSATGKSNFFPTSSAENEKKRFREEVVTDLSRDKEFLTKFIANISDEELEILTKKAKHSPPTSPKAIKSH